MNAEKLTALLAPYRVTTVPTMTYGQPMSRLCRALQDAAARSYRTAA